MFPGGPPPGGPPPGSPPPGGPQPGGTPGAPLGLPGILGLHGLGFPGSPLSGPLPGGLFLGGPLVGGLSSSGSSGSLGSPPGGLYWVLRLGICCCLLCEQGNSLIKIGLFED